MTAIPVCLGLRQGPLAGFLALPLPMLALSSLAGRPAWVGTRQKKQGVRQAPRLPEGRGQHWPDALSFTLLLRVLFNVKVIKSASVEYQILATKRSGKQRVEFLLPPYH